jgi:hypothetical protein
MNTVLMSEIENTSCMVSKYLVGSQVSNSFLSKQMTRLPTHSKNYFIESVELFDVSVDVLKRSYAPIKWLMVLEKGKYTKCVYQAERDLLSAFKVERREEAIAMLVRKQGIVVFGPNYKSNNSNENDEHCQMYMQNINPIITVFMSQATDNILLCCNETTKSFLEEKYKRVNYFSHSLLETIGLDK